MNACVCVSMITYAYLRIRVLFFMFLQFLIHLKICLFLYMCVFMYLHKYFNLTKFNVFFLFFLSPPVYPTLMFHVFVCVVWPMKWKCLPVFVILQFIVCCYLCNNNKNNYHQPLLLIMLLLLLLLPPVRWMCAFAYVWLNIAHATLWMLQKRHCVQIQQNFSSVKYKWNGDANKIIKSTTNGTSINKMNLANMRGCK